jgi:hypothetical protein
MKGRRKLKTAKWHLKAQFEAEARKILGSEDHSRRAGRFLSKAAAHVGSAEPTGLLAGKHHSRPQL